MTDNRNAKWNPFETLIDAARERFADPQAEVRPEDYSLVGFGYVGDGIRQLRSIMEERLPQRKDGTGKMRQIVVKLGIPGFGGAGVGALIIALLKVFGHSS